MYTQVQFSYRKGRKVTYLCTFMRDGSVEFLPISAKVAARLIKRGMGSGS